MHIVQLANFHGPRSGGIKVVLDELARRYCDAGHRCSLIVPAESNGVDGPAHRRVHRIAAPLMPGLGGYRVIVNRAAVRDVLANDPPDIIELSDKTTLLSASQDARGTTAPVVLISHERLDAVITRVVSGHRAVRRMVHRYNRHVANRVDAIVAASRFAAEEFDDHPYVPLYRVPLGVDLDCFTPSPRSSQSDRAHMVAVVRLSPEKNPQLLVDTVRVLVERGKRVHLDVIGDGPLRDDLEQGAVGLPLTFHGHIADRKRVAQYLGSADVVVAPGPHETFGLAGLEALSCGTPVVVPDEGALRELVIDGVGRVAASHAESFATAIADVVRWDRHVTRRRCREHAERYNWASTAGAMLDVFDSVRRERTAVA